MLRYFPPFRYSSSGFFLLAANLSSYLGTSITMAAVAVNKNEAGARW